MKREAGDVKQRDIFFFSFVDGEGSCVAAHRVAALHDTTRQRVAAQHSIYKYMAT